MAVLQRRNPSPLKHSAAQVTVVIPNWNGRKHLYECLNSLNKQVFKNFNVLVVDNSSEDDSVSYIRKSFPNVAILELGENRGFGAACNAGIESSNSEYIALLNNDTIVDPNWLLELVNTMGNAPDSVTSLASKMVQLHNPRLIDDAGDILTWRGGTFKRGHGEDAERYKLCEEVFSPCAGAALYRRSSLLAAGLFDESFFLYLEDIDLGVRMRLAGGKCLYVPSAIVQHIGHGSSFPHDRYVYFIARNRPTLFLKNFPFTVLLRHSHSLIYGWFFYYLAYNRPKPYLLGTLAAIKNLPSNFRKKRHIARKLNRENMHAMLSNEWPEISIVQLISERFKARFQ